MKDHFYTWADDLFRKLRKEEVLLCFFEGERSDFVRFNGNKVRHAGTVVQRVVRIQLISGARHATTSVSLAGVPGDSKAAAAILDGLRDVLGAVQDDPHLLYNTDVSSSDRVEPGLIPSPGDALATIRDGATGMDLVGLWAAGQVYRGFANSLGQRNWFETPSFHLDFSAYVHGDKAVKSSYAGTQWDSAHLLRILGKAREDAEVLVRPPKTVSRGNYRVFLTPSALAEIVGLLAWSDFGAEVQRTRRSSLARALSGDARMSDMVSIRESMPSGVAPPFQAQGFPKPDEVVLVDRGRCQDSLVSPRSAMEYGLLTNADESESPSSVVMDPGGLPMAEALSALDTGIYVSNLWYLNYSDRPACRMTGMTRFATLWVEGGKPIAPISVMRFDETIYRVLGSNLVALTQEQELLLDPGTYEKRSTASFRLPGALVDDFSFTL
ncbi:MAG: hypothetical protein KC416_11315 [Myxococcales bacterium]|nr:hypothetical protein [Myxococcales bacterium]